MARTRNIKPGFFENEELAELPFSSRMLFAGLWCWADREGRMEDRPKRIKGQILPYDDCDVDEMLQQLADSSQRFITRYEVDGCKYIQINNFRQHQHCHVAEVHSTIPAPCNNHTTPCQGVAPYKNGTSTVQEPNENALLLTASSLLLTANCSETTNVVSSSTPGVEGNGQVHKKKREKPSLYTEHFSEWWAEFPKRVEKPEAAKEYQLAIRRICKDDEIPEAKTCHDAHIHLLEKTKQFAASDKGLGPKKYILSPERWLKKECYKDDQSAWSDEKLNDQSLLVREKSLPFLEEIPE
jgi:hypothetical protein